MLGPEGSGKSTVLRRLLAELELTESDTVICDGSQALGADGLVAVLRSRLQLPARPEPRSLWGSRPLEDLLANQRARGKPLVVLVDDAHVLPRPSLMLLAELAAKPAATDPAVFVVLAGSPALEQPGLRAWGGARGGRSAVTCRVGPLTTDEVYSPWIAAQSFSECSQDVSTLQATHMNACYRVQNQCHHGRTHGWRPVTANAT